MAATATPLCSDCFNRRAILTIACVNSMKWKAGDAI